MKIAVLGAGAMGMLFGGYLSRENQVYLVDVNPERIEKIRNDGVMIREADKDIVLKPNAVVDASGLGKMDLIIVFVKAMFTISALETNKHLIGKNTYLMTLQNGAGHESKLLQFVDKDRVIIGSTQHNSSILGNGHVNHGGGGKTSIGLLTGNSERVAPVAQTLTNCGIDCTVNDEVKRQIWNKLFLNTAASSLTAVLQVPLGFILEDPNACSIMEKMAKEAVDVANAEGIASFDDAAVIEDIKTVLKNAKGGYTSIYADIRDGNRTEVDTISGSVVDAAKEMGVPVPCHEMVVSLIHAMEDKATANKLKENIMSEYSWTAGNPKRVLEQLPPKSYTKGKLHIVDLTKVLDPNNESRRCRLWRYNTGGSIPDFHTIMDLTSHLGTHCECPYHHSEDWPSVAELPLTNFMGRGRYIVLQGVAPRGIITADILDAQAKDIQPGDTVILDSEYRIAPFTPLTNTDADQRLCVNGETAQWFADHGVQCVGFGDGVSIEDCEENVKPFHDILMTQNCTFLEVLQNLDQLTSDTFFISYAPLPIIGLDSCPVRVYAIEGLNEFC